MARFHVTHISKLSTFANDKFENCIFNQHILITIHFFHHLHILSFSVIIIKTIFALSHKEQLHLQQVLKVVSGPETTESQGVQLDSQLPSLIYICSIDIRSKPKEQLNERRAGLSMFNSTNIPLQTAI